MAVWGTFRLPATVANRRLDMAQCVVDRVAERKRRPIFVTVVPVAAPVAEVDMRALATEGWWSTLV